jgi:hypothetical protein
MNDRIHIRSAPTDPLGRNGKQYVVIVSSSVNAFAPSENLWKKRKFRDSKKRLIATVVIVLVIGGVSRLFAQQREDGSARASG